MEQTLADDAPILAGRGLCAASDAGGAGWCRVVVETRLVMETRLDKWAAKRTRSQESHKSQRIKVANGEPRPGPSFTGFILCSQLA
jgi:hypothetical protein